jgi:hypothetical protein
MLKIMAITSAVWVLGTVASSAAREEKVRVRLIGPRTSVIADRILGQVHAVPFDLQHDAPILLQGKTLASLGSEHAQELQATYQAGHTIVLLDATLAHIRTLHGILGVGVTYRSHTSGLVLAYALRHENHIPTATLLTNMDRSPLRTPSGDPDPQGLLDEDLALTRAADHTVTELRHLPQVSMPGPPRDPTQPNVWQDNPVQTITLAYNGAQGVYNTPIKVYALHSCSDGTDRYVVTAGADWTATNAKWQGATSEEPNPTMFLNDNDKLVINWQDTRTYCSSPEASLGFQDVCRYINYPLSYDLRIVPPPDGTVIQTDAAPAGTQGQATSYTSGFSFSIGGTVNVSSSGPGGGISAGAMWVNTTQTTVPPLIVDVSNTGNEGVDWTFRYCTTGLEPDPGTNCTGHVQMVRDVCQAQLGDDSGTNPQQGQTPVGKLSNAVQSVYWEAHSDTRVGSTFDITVTFTANIATTIAHLGSVGNGPDPNAGCNDFSCACVSETQLVPVSQTYTFEVPFPSTTCQ